MSLLTPSYHLLRHALLDYLDLALLLADARVQQEVEELLPARGVRLDLRAVEHRLVLEVVGEEQPVVFGDAADLVPALVAEEGELVLSLL